MSDYSKHSLSLNTKIVTDLIGILNSRGFYIPDMRSIPDGKTPTQHADAIVKALLYHINIGHDFAVIMKAINESPMLKDQWDEFLFSLKMLEGKHGKKT
jgi:hypothetical protein